MTEIDSPLTRAMKLKASLAAPKPAPAAHVNGTTVNGTLHPYAARGVEAELGRLDALPRPWLSGSSYWDTTTYEVACNLIEFANSPWSQYSHAQAEADLRAHAPSDHKWGDKEHTKCWKSARDTIGGGARPEPGPLDHDHLPSVNMPEAEVDGPRLNLCIDWHALWATEDEGEEWILEPILPARRMVALYSAPKAGKSLLVLEMAVGISRGTEVLGYTPDRARRVLYVDFENDPRGDIRHRLQNMEIGPDDLADLRYLSFPTLAKFDTAQGALDLMRHVEAEQAEVVIIDTVSRAVSGEENDNDTWLAFYRNVGLALKQAGVACLRLDHSGKDKEKGMRGGSAKAGDVDAVWQLSVVGTEKILLECTHNRMQVPDKRLLVGREEWPLRHVVLDDTRAALRDAQAVELDLTLNNLGVLPSASVREVKAALKESGHSGRVSGFGGSVIAAVVANRKLRLDLAAPRVPGTPGEHP